MWLETAASEGARLRAFALEQDGNWIGTCPFFDSRRGPLRTWMSPGTGLGIPFLGPTLGLPRRGSHAAPERRWHELGDALVRYIGSNGPRSFVRIIAGPSLGDVRPFVWGGYRVTPRYTYRLDLSGSEGDLRARADREARRWIHIADKQLTFRDGGSLDAAWIVSELAKRYEAQGRRLPFGSEYVRRLFDRLPAGSLRTELVAREGRPVTGLIVVDEPDTVRHWIGGFRPNPPEPGAGEYLIWRSALRARELGKSSLDLLGANTPAIVRFKRKFGPELRTHFMVEKASPWARAALRLAGRRR